MGFGFAKWSDTVTIGATVATGNVDIKIDKGCVNDFGADPNKCPGDNRERKDVGSIKLTKVDDSNLKVEIKNGINYKPGFGFKITSEGTIPVKDSMKFPALTGMVCCTITSMWLAGNGNSGNSLKSMENTVMIELKRFLVDTAILTGMIYLNQSVIGSFIKGTFLKFM